MVVMTVVMVMVSVMVVSPATITTMTPAAPAPVPVRVGSRIRKGLGVRIGDSIRAGKGISSHQTGRSDGENQGELRRTRNQPISVYARVFKCRGEKRMHARNIKVCTISTIAKREGY